MGQEVENLALKGERQEVPGIKAFSLAELNEVSLTSFAVPETPTEGDMLPAYTSTLLIGTAVIAFVFMAILWLVRPFGIDERSIAPEERGEAG